jgi:hypothetical protein
MSGSTPPGSARPQVQVDPSMAAKRQPTHTNSPQSAIIDVPPGWQDSPASGSGRGSMEIDLARRSIETVSLLFLPSRSLSTLADVSLDIFVLLISFGGLSLEYFQ